jgi:hypothetical protein
MKPCPDFLSVLFREKPGGGGASHLGPFFERVLFVQVSKYFDDRGLVVLGGGQESLSKGVVHQNAPPAPRPLINAGTEPLHGFGVGMP